MRFERKIDSRRMWQLIGYSLMIIAILFTSGFPLPVSAAEAAPQTLLVASAPLAARSAEQAVTPTPTPTEPAKKPKLTPEPGQTEANEQLSITLVSTSSGAVLGTPVSTTLTIVDNDISNITTVSGGGQSTTVGTAFNQPLVAQVATTSNAQVTFTAPASGASGTFAGGATTYTGTTDASGQITTPTFSANTIAGSYTVSATVSGGTTPATFSLTNLSAAARAVNMVSGGGQSTPASTTFAQPLVAKVVDAYNNPVSGIYVSFLIYGDASTPSAKFASGNINYNGNTDASGLITTSLLTANSNTGSFKVVVFKGAVPDPNNPIYYNLIISGPPTEIMLVSGSGQSAMVNTTFAQPLVAKVVDSNSNPVSGTTVTFTAPTSNASGTFAGGATTYTGTTDASGLITTTAFTANGIGGSYTVDATVNGVASPANFSLTNVLLPPTLGMNFNPSTIAYNQPTANLTFDLTNPNPSTTLTNLSFGSSLPSGFIIGGGALTTNSCGANLLNPPGSSSFQIKVPSLAAGANCSLTLSLDHYSTTPGSYTVNLTSISTDQTGTSSLNASATLTVTVDPPAQITVVSGSNQTTIINTAFAQPLVAKIVDSSNHPVSGVTVTFTAPTSGASSIFQAGTITSTTFVGSTDASGTVSTTTFTANPVAGSYTVSATVNGVASSANFSLTNLPECDPLVVTSNLDDGSCGTLRTALNTASSGASKQVTITLSAGSAITLTTGLTLTTGVSITTTAGCATGPAITLQGSGNSSGNGLTLSSGNSVYGLWIKGFSGQQIVAPSGGGNLLRCLKATKS